MFFIEDTFSMFYNIEITCPHYFFEKHSFQVFLIYVKTIHNSIFASLTKQVFIFVHLQHS